LANSELRKNEESPSQAQVLLRKPGKQTRFQRILICERQTKNAELGIIGEYLARLYYRVMERPAYVIGETVETREGDGPRAGA
jgi:hypothetical protein